MVNQSKELCQVSQLSRKNHEPVIYFAHDEASKAVKIGTTTNLDKRIYSLRTSCPRWLVCLGTVPGGVDEERKLHRLFAPARLRGEWFHADEVLLKTIRIMIVEQGKPRTVQDELDRRSNCRFGLKGVLVALEGSGREPFKILCSSWNRYSKLVLDICDPNDDEIVGGLPPAKPGEFRIYSLAVLARLKIQDPISLRRNVPAERCFLLSDWPIVCRCWCERKEP